MNTQKSAPEEVGNVGDNSVRPGTEKAEQIIKALNTDPADAYVLYHQLHKYHQNIEDAEHLRTYEFLQEAYEEVEGAVDETVERLQFIGGVSHVSMPALSEAATVELEDEDVYNIRTSLSNDLETCSDIIENYREHIKLVAGLRDHTTAHMPREQLIEIEEHVHVIDHYLEDDTPVQ